MENMNQEAQNQPQKKRRPYYVYLACLLLIYFFIVPGKDRSRSHEQLEFDKWVSSVEKTYFLPDGKGGSRAEEQLKKVKISLSGNSSGGPISWNLDGSDPNDIPKPAGLPESETQEHQSKVLRVLSLMREANIFTPSGESTEGRNLKVQVETEDGKFEAPISESMISKNVQAQLMLRLFKEYSSEESTRLAEKGDANAG